MTKNQFLHLRSEKKTCKQLWFVVNSFGDQARQKDHLNYEYASLNLGENH